MLLQFRYQNHRSFREEAALSLVDPNDSGRGSRGLQIAAVYGANAAGKSNVLDALALLARVVSNGTTKKVESLPCHPFRFDESTAEAPCEFELVFRLASETYTYAIAFSRDAIRSESLHLGFGRGARSMFQRNGQAFRFGEMFEGSERRQLAELVGQGTRPNQPFVREAEERNLTEVGAVTEWVDSRLVMILASSRFLQLGKLLEQELSFRELAGSLLHGADTGITAVHVKRIDTSLPSEKREQLVQAFQNLFRASGVEQDRSATEALFPAQQPKVLLSHRGAAGSLHLLELEDESDGTQRLLHLAPALWPRNESDQRVFVVDEIDQSLHPQVVEHFVSEFRRQRPDCQLIFTTHAEHLLNRGTLRPEEVWFVKKSREGASSLYSLYEYDPAQLEELMTKHDGFGKGYLQGRFGAVPRVRPPRDESDS